MCTSERERFFAGTNSRPFRDKLSRVHRYFLSFSPAPFLFAVFRQRFSHVKQTSRAENTFCKTKKKKTRLVPKNNYRTLGVYTFSSENTDLNRRV